MPNNQPVILSSLVNCTCFAVTHWKPVHVYYMVFFSFCPVPQNSCILCSENASSFSKNRRSTLTTKIEKPVAVLRICAGARRKKKTKLLVFPPSAATWLKVLTAGGSRYQSVEAARRGRSVAGEDESHSLTTLSSGSNHSAPGKTYPDVVLLGSPLLPHRHTFMGHTWATYHGGLVSKFPFLHMSTFVRLLCICRSLLSEQNLCSNLALAGRQ